MPGWRRLRRERGLFTIPMPPMPTLPPLDPPLQVVLVSPSIPPNTGNVARTCAVTGSRLHLVGPLGFSLADKDLRRAGLDYWREVAPEVHRDWPEFEARALRGQTEKLHLFTARAERGLGEARFAPGDFLVFGQEQLGLPPALLAAWPERQLGIPMRDGARSLNLAVAAGVALYAALAAIGRGGAKPQ
jgi:tRNA (cytidine/uridine-2'-O-)-methyltransferase